MCQEPTELFWIGCLTGLILILKIQIRYIDTKHQFADILTKGNFRRNEWNNLLHLFNISRFSSTCCAKNSCLISCSKNDGEKDARAKRRRKKCGKIETYSNELVFSCSDKFLIREKSDCIQKSGVLTATGKPESRRRRNSKSDAVLSSQARLGDAYLGGLMDPATEEPVATKEESEDVDLSESETGSDEDVTWKPVACKTATGKPYASSKSDCQGGPKAAKIEWSRNPHVSPATIHRHCDRGLASEKNKCCATFPGTFCMDVTPVACFCV